MKGLRLAHTPPRSDAAQHKRAKEPRRTAIPSRHPARLFVAGEGPVKGVKGSDGFSPFVPKQKPFAGQYAKTLHNPSTLHTLHRVKRANERRYP